MRAYTRADFSEYSMQIAYTEREREATGRRNAREIRRAAQLTRLSLSPREAARIYTA